MTGRAWAGRGAPEKNKHKNETVNPNSCPTQAPARIKYDGTNRKLLTKMQRTKDTLNINTTCKHGYLQAEWVKLEHVPHNPPTNTFKTNLCFERNFHHGEADFAEVLFGVLHTVYFLASRFRHVTRLFFACVHTFWFCFTLGLLDAAGSK